jgi:hypothetical protein
MKRNLLISFLFLIVMTLIMRFQGHTLVTPLSPRGILDLEFARNVGRLRQLLLFWNERDVTTNIYLDFVFIAAYTWFLVSACNYVKAKTGWEKWTNIFTTLAISAGAFDLVENFLMLLVLNDRFDASILQIVFICALIKFALVGMVVLFLLGALPFALMKGKR